MSTLAEIKNAIAALPVMEQRELYRRLGARIGDGPAMAKGSAPARNTKARDWARNARGSVRGFPISAGSELFSTEDVARIESEA